MCSLLACCRTLWLGFLALAAGSLTPAAAAAAARTAPASLPLVVLDPGHGGSATGGRGICGAWEKDVTLAVAQKAASLLDSTQAARVLLTRETDVFVGLEARVALANASGGNVFISVHANASPNAEARGIETFFLSQTASTSRLTRLLERENEGRIPRFHQRKSALSVVLGGLALDALEAQSQRLAIELQRGMAEGLSTRGRGVLQAPFVVLMGSKMPSALAEIGFLTHAEECLHLIDEQGQWRAAEALVAGILSFLHEPT